MEGLLCEIWAPIVSFPVSFPVGIGLIVGGFMCLPGWLGGLLDCRMQSLRGEEADDNVYRKSQKDLKDNLDNIAMIPLEVYITL